MAQYKQEIEQYLKKKNLVPVFETPKNPEFGDFAIPCFHFSKELKKNPAEIAKELASEHEKKFPKLKITATGPYINFLLDRIELAKETIEKILKEKEKYGSLNLKKSALIEHTSINPNASPHLGRARNALIGDSIARLLKFNGYKTEIHYFVNDIGKQIAMLVFGTKDKKNLKFNDLLEEYIKINKKVEENPELEKEIFELLNKLENGDKKTIELFRKVVSICIKGQEEILSELGIKYDSFDYESDFIHDKRINDILEKLKKTGKLFVDEEKRTVLNLEGFNLPSKAPILVLTRADGTSLYPLRDIAYTEWKMDKASERNVLVLGEDQKLYFMQVAASMSLLKRKSPEVIHYSFVLLAEGKMSTRKGTVVLLEDFMKEAREKAKLEIIKREMDYSKKEIDEISRAVAYAAVKYSFLRVSPDKNVTFDWDSSLSFEGETGPYIQYSYARIKSILRKSEAKKEKIDYFLLKADEEKNLMRELSSFPQLIKELDENLKIHSVTQKTYYIAKLFNEFYHNCPVLNAEFEELRNARLVLIEATAIVLKIGLNLLGIDAPEKM
jgi:arginyl-tRNA synthetase